MEWKKHYDPCQEDQIQKRDLDGMLKEILKALSVKERRVVENLYGLDGVMPTNKKEVARKFGISVTEVEQIEKKAIRRLRTPSTSKNLKPFLSE